MRSCGKPNFGDLFGLLDESPAECCASQEFNAACQQVLGAVLKPREQEIVEVYLNAGFVPPKANFGLNEVQKILKKLKKFDFCGEVQTRLGCRENQSVAS